MSAASSEEFSAREWKDGEAHEVLPKVFLGSMVRFAVGPMMPPVDRVLLFRVSGVHRRREYLRVAMLKTPRKRAHSPQPA